MAEAKVNDKDKKITPDEMMRYATDELYAVRPQPPTFVISQILAALDVSMHPVPPVEEPPKDLDEAVSRIEAKLGQVEPPIKNKPDLEKIAAQAEPPVAEASKAAPKEPSHATGSHR